MANIPGATNVLPGVFTDVITQSRGVSIPGGSRIAALIGEGSTDQTLVSQAQGGGKDGLNPTYTSLSGADGRHFLISNAPLISNRTTLFKNGIPLVGLESLIDSGTFSNKYDYRVDIATGRVELQRAHLVDKGGYFYAPLSTNVGAGTINALTLLDANAPPEVWSIKCVSVQRNVMNQPVANTAKFIAYGSVSGNKLDGYGNPVIWTAGGSSANNGVLSFSITETSPVFREGDAFTLSVASGVLVRSDSLTANFIPVVNLNDPVFLQGLGDVVSRHGIPSLDNNLSLGCQLAFANSAPALITVQAAPPMPRRLSFVLEDSVNSVSTNDDDYIFPLPAGVTPDVNSNVHFFVTDNSTGVERQILPNKFAFYTLDSLSNPTLHDFIVDSGTYAYYYSVIEAQATVASGFDGYINRSNPAQTNQALFSSGITFDTTYTPAVNPGYKVKVIDSTNYGNIQTYDISSVVNGQLVINFPTTLPNLVTDTVNQVSYQVIAVATDNVVYDGYTDGYISVSGPGTATLSHGAGSLNFAAIPNIGTANTYRIKISGAVDPRNNSTFDVISGTQNSTQVDIRRALVTEKNLRFEVINTNDVSNYVVVNQNVVPDGNALRVTVIDHKEASFYDAGWITALEALETVECDIVVPLPKQTISVIFQNVLNHCKTMSNIRNKKERVMFAGAISGLTPDNLTGAKPAAVENIGILEGIQGETIADVLDGNVEDLANYSVPDAFGNTYRAVYFYPDQIVVQAGTDNVLIDGFYLAAAAAGYEAADVKLENPLTNKVLSGFTILRNRLFSPAVLEQLAAAGVTTLQPVAGGGRIVWGITTSQSGYAEEQEISIVFIRDRVAKVLRAGFAGFIGNPESPDTGAILNTRAVVLLNALSAQGLITNFKDLSVARDSADPRQWNIAVRVQPTYPVNFIYIKVSLGQL
jgi:hypothetical protein